MSTRWLYQTEGGGMYFDVQTGVARCVGRGKMFLGDDDTIKRKIVEWLNSFCGSINYVTMVDKKKFESLTDEQIKINLNRFKRDAEIEEHIARRPCGAYDVIREWMKGEIHYTAWSQKKTFKTNTSQSPEVIKEKLMKLFSKQGYYKQWDKNEKSNRSIAPGICARSVWTIIYCAPEYNSQ